MFEHGRKRTIKEVLAEADLMEQRYREINNRQKKRIDRFMAFLEQTNQVEAFVRWDHANEWE